jgi:hypothetical protein
MCRPSGCLEQCTGSSDHGEVDLSLGGEHARVQAALEATCAALLALEGARAATAHVEAPLTALYHAECRALELIRAALDEARASAGAGSPLALGFARERTAAP